jgi:hypothetical protein
MRYFNFIFFIQVGQRIGERQTRFSEDNWLEIPLCCARNPEVSHAFPHSLQEILQNCTLKWTTTIFTQMVTNS